MTEYLNSPKAVSPTQKNNLRSSADPSVDAQNEFRSHGDSVGTSATQGPSEWNKLKEVSQTSWFRL